MLKVVNVDKNGNDIPIRVYKNEKGKYTMPISIKVNGEYVNKYFPTEFLKDIELDNKTDIILKHAFLTGFDWEYEEKTGTKFLIKVTAFEVASTPEEEKPTEEVTPHNIDKWEAGKNVVIPEDELPFY